MGEAKRRRESDPYFGCFPRHGKGIIVSHPISVLDGRVQIGQTLIDPSELRRAILFFDRIVWPNSSFIGMGGNDAETAFLIEAGILSRPVVQTDSGTVAEMVIRSYAETFKSLDAKEPGAWAFAAGDDLLGLISNSMPTGRSGVIELFKAIPVPDRDIPLNELLEFKHKRLDEVRRLTVELDSLYQSIISSSDRDHAFRLSINKIDQACSDMIKVSKGEKNPFRLSNWKMSFNLNGGMIGAIIGSFIDHKTLLPGAGMALGGLASCISLGTEQGIKTASSRCAPYRYVASLESDLL